MGSLHTYSEQECPGSGWGRTRLTIDVSPVKNIWGNTASLKMLCPPICSSIPPLLVGKRWPPSHKPWGPFSSCPLTLEWTFQECHCHEKQKQRTVLYYEIKGVWPANAMGESFFFFLIIYLAVQDLSCGMRDLCFGMWDLLVVARKLLVAVCGIKFPDQESNLGPLHWEQEVLATGPPGKSHNVWILIELRVGKK